MDNEDKRQDVRAHVHSQDRQDDSEPTEPNTNKNRVCSIVSTDCEVSGHNRTYSSDDYQLVQNIKCEDEDIVCHRECHSVGVCEVRCLLRVKIEEEEEQDTNDRETIEPLNCPGQPTTWINDVDEFVDVKQEKKVDVGECCINNEETRHWVVCSDNVLKEVKAKHAVSKSGAECCSDIYEKNLHRSVNDANAEETETNVILSTSSARGLSLPQSRHLETGEGANKFTCGRCGMLFTQNDRFDVHQSSHACTNSFTCVPTKILTGAKHLACSTCGKLSKCSSKLKTHQKMHSNERPFACATCLKSFKHFRDLRMHETIHSGVKPFSCTTCGKSFTGVGQLKGHERIHTGLKHFTCTTCDKSFTRVFILKQHELTHTGLKPFSCTTCNKSFLRRDQLKVHGRIHLGVKPFSCTTCGMPFACSRNLRRHLNCGTCSTSVAQ